MILTGKEIQKRLGKDIVIKPFNIENLNTNSYNLTLSNRLFVYTSEIADSKVKPTATEVIIPEDGLVIQPNRIYIGTTNEYTETFNLVPKITGKSSLGRLGVFTNISATLGDVGYKGHWSLQIYSIQAVKIYPNMRIAQIYYEIPYGDITNYAGNYQNTASDATTKIDISAFNASNVKETE